MPSRKSKWLIYWDLEYRRLLKCRDRRITSNESSESPREGCRIKHRFRDEEEIVRSDTSCQEEQSSVIQGREHRCPGDECSVNPLHKVRNHSAVWLVLSWYVCSKWNLECNPLRKGIFSSDACKVFCDKVYIQQWFPTLRLWNFKMWVVSPRDWNSNITVWKFWETIENIFILVMKSEAKRS